ncbi:peptide chain release factor 1 [Haploplasma modicum]|jgi:peptide chain release factor 1|uniref:peptide chain release factor 1 n=1 Tax=Haploplasma modicum TaxID=2150 RepID=UPI00214AA4CF|nr:peptide chain release factor 1 [Haploplasma modicum]MCR1809313.1 peptide chain release factor 1 [Haploplasma modicum]
MFDRLKIMDEKYREIQDKLISGSLSVKEMTGYLKESSQLEDAVTSYRIYLSKENEVKELKELLEIEDDVELIGVAKDEIKTLEHELEKIEEDLRILLLPKDPNDDKNVMIEIKGAAGGDEGNIFAGDLFRMYSKYAEANNWKVEILDASEGTSGGFTSIEFMVSGKKAYSFLKYESGTHRVQRVPETESQGRIHTSTSTVIVMPEAEEIDFELNWNDIRVDVFRASGAGGQHVNTTDSAVRLTHIPSGLVVASQLGKSQHENKETAFKILKTRLYDKMLKDQSDKEAQERNKLVGRGDRSEKVRTYNYPQNRVTDHRVGLTLNRLDAIIDGKLELIIEPLINYYQKLQLEGNKNENN